MIGVELGHRGYSGAAVSDWERDQSKIDEDVLNPRTFTGGEYCPVSVPEAIEGKRVYLVASPNPDKGTPQDLFGRILIAADALKRNGAKEVWLLPTDLHYSRQDRGPHDVEEAEKAREAEKKRIESGEEGEPIEHKMKGQSLTAMVQARHFKTARIDKVIPVHHHSERLYEKSKEPKQLWIIRGCNHLNVFTGNPSETEYRTKLTQFFNNYRL